MVYKGGFSTKTFSTVHGLLESINLMFERVSVGFAERCFVACPNQSKFLYQRNAVRESLVVTRGLRICIDGAYSPNWSMYEHRSVNC